MQILGKNHWIAIQQRFKFMNCYKREIPFLMERFGIVLKYRILSGLIKNIGYFAWGMILVDCP